MFTIFEKPKNFILVDVLDERGNLIETKEFAHKPNAKAYYSAKYGNNYKWVDRPWEDASVAASKEVYQSTYGVEMKGKV